MQPSHQFAKVISDGISYMELALGLKMLFAETCPAFAYCFSQRHRSNLSRVSSPVKAQLDSRRSAVGLSPHGTIRLRSAMTVPSANEGTTDSPGREGRLLDLRQRRRLSTPFLKQGALVLRAGPGRREGVLILTHFCYAPEVDVTLWLQLWCM